MDKNEIILILSNTPTFNKLSSEDIAAFLEICEVKQYLSGEIIYQEGSPPDYFYFLLKGRVVALTHQEVGEVEIDLLKRGTSFGIISIFSGDPHSVTTKAIETSFILRAGHEHFKEFLNKHPAISLDFSRMLTQRVKAKTQTRPKKIFQVKHIGIIGFPSAGKTTYLYNLALRLKEETGKKVICLEVSSSDNFVLPYLAKNEAKALSLAGFNEETLPNFIIKGEIDYLLLKVTSPANFSALLNNLCESYHFILYEIPFYFWDNYFDDFVSPADYIHFVLFPQIEELRRAGILMSDLKTKHPTIREKLKVIINEFGSKDIISYTSKCDLLNQPVYATLPASSGEPYTKVLRRISRQTADLITGLALGSGAAFGYAHIGVLKAFEENDITIDIICGSSMGSVIATLWAMGLKPDEIAPLAQEFGRKTSNFMGISFPFKGVIRARRLESICKKIFGNKTFYDLKHMLKVVAFDFAKREIIVLEEGLLYKAVAASCAMPGLFEPVKLKEDILLDGGILTPLPTKILLNYGVNRIIAINITPSQEEIRKEYQRHNKMHVFDFIFGSIETMQREFIQQAVGIADVVVHPSFAGLGWMEFEKIEELMARGYLAAKEKIQEIKSLT
ncbi:MAG: patatin-like phospholipase family protein [Candidatus Omnitrophica bacterium]|nr:patatin-like phospholipase family protein [Candidatus Omnitrophota bacterium]